MWFTILFACVTVKDIERSNAQLDLAAAHVQEDNPQAAIASLENAVDLNRKNMDAWNLLGVAYMQRGAHEQAEDTFKKAIRKDKAHAGTRLNYAYLLQKLERHDEAIEHLLVANEDLTYPEPAKILNNLGWAYLQTGNTAQAVAVLEEAVFRQPNWCGSRYNLAAAYAAAGEQAKAAELASDVANTCADEFPEAALIAGEAYLDMGRMADGQAWLQAVVDQHPGTPLGSQAKERLAAEGL
ncbi:MAG: tetratricopeptide repeat protein [Proteobacteria bacterium]|nr:tetratricopeptide repeat protein [Pseudomonadota bacterium]MCP4921887.1 tetratricopeptide repeat protein [Pseudomonadota bacterium]